MLQVWDVLKFLILMVFILAALTAGNYVLFNSLASEDAADEGAASLPAECSDLEAMRGQLRGSVSGPDGSWYLILFVLANGMISGDSFATCFMAVADRWYWLLAWIYSYLFLIITAVLLLNMLIAIMAKTFDNVWEAASVNHQMLFARVVYAQWSCPPEPPPLNILGLPWVALGLLCTLASRALKVGSPLRSLLERVVRSIDAAVDYSPYIDHSIASNVDAATEEYVGTTVGSRNTFTSWKKGRTVAELRSMLIEYVYQHQDEVAQEDRWRSKMLKRITSAVERSQRLTSSKLSQQEEVLGELKATVQQLAQEVHGRGSTRP